MKRSTLIYSALIAVAMYSCGNENKEPENTGTNQVEAPVMNSGPETEAERANDAVEQDSTNSVPTVGKDEKEPTRSRQTR